MLMLSQISTVVLFWIQWLEPQSMFPFVVRFLTACLLLRVRPKALFWFRTDTDTQAQIGPYFWTNTVTYTETRFQYIFQIAPLHFKLALSQMHWLMQQPLMLQPLIYNRVEVNKGKNHLYFVKNSLKKFLKKKSFRTSSKNICQKFH